MTDCKKCIEKKETALTHTRCEGCGLWRPMTDDEIKKVKKRHVSSSDKK